ncbi:MAG: DUF2283 domain-containing protein [Cyanobacteria bacterium J06648_16]
MSAAAETTSAGSNQIRLAYDPERHSLTIWFGTPTEHYERIETGSDVVLMKDAAGVVVGFEKLKFSPFEPLEVVLETDEVFTESSSANAKEDEVDVDDEPKEVVLEGLRQAWKEAKAGQTVPLSQLWEGLEVD